MVELDRQTESQRALSAEDLLRAAFKYQDALTSYAYALLQDWPLAQDAVQETFIVLQKKHAQFRPGANVFTWARQMVRFEALNLLRARGRESCVIDEQLFALVDAQFDEHFDADALARMEQQKAALQHCMTRLERGSLDLLLGFYKDRLSCDQLAGARRRSVNAIRLSLSRIRGKLRDCMRHRLALAEVKP
ncbi:MAG TPA: sigma-70 family RNA polymerase sigma factor [Methylomirabilota bacterium]|nr:sigma-70 family RNA polymerase sigma factor [Methylomirabilota bacterium]